MRALLTSGERNCKLRRPPLLSKNAKIDKSDAAARGFITWGLSLAPNTISGFNVCPRFTPECQKNCIFSAGKGGFKNVSAARIRKTRFFFEHRAEFLELFRRELARYQRRATVAGLRLAVRPNVFSDLPWERICPELIEEFSAVQWYDYTKVPGRIVPPNYHLTFSWSGENEADCLSEFARGRNIAVPFRGPKPALWHGIPVINGDAHDLRFLDPVGVIVGLTAKGRGRYEKRAGFIVQTGA